MEDKKIDTVIVDEISEPTEPAVDPKWIKLVGKLANHPKNKTLILMPGEAQLLTSKLREITSQLINSMSFINKYAPFMEKIAEVETSVRAAGGTSDDAIDSGASRLDSGGDGVDPEDLHNALTPE